MVGEQDGRPQPGACRRCDEPTPPVGGRPQHGVPKGAVGGGAASWLPPSRWPKARRMLRPHVPPGTPAWDAVRAGPTTGKTSDASQDPNSRHTQEGS